MSSLRHPSPGTLMLGILLCGAIAVSAFVLSVVSLGQKVEDSQRDSLCRFYGYFVNLDKPPTTPRGKASLDTALAEYRALKCEPPR